MEQYGAGIVLYNPNIERLKKNLDAICPQVKQVYCFNNGLNDSEAICELLNSYSNITLIGCGKNLGIATALNRLVEAAHVEGMEWIITLDQDSVVCNGMVEALATLKDERDVAVICPIIEDIRRKNEKPVMTSNTKEDVEFCITSGSFMSVHKIIEIGGFDDWLFIGLVDDDLCYRVKLNGYRIIRNNAVVLNHELGNITPSKFERIYLKLGEILHSETIKKLSYKREVNPMRLYYATRNMIYLKKRYLNYMDKQMWNKRIIINSTSSFIRGGCRLDILRAILAGVREGNALDVEPFIVQRDNFSKI